MPRPSWTGFLKLSLVSCPIYLSPASTGVEKVSFHQINPKTGNRIKLVVQDAETGEPLERGDLIKGYEYEKGQYVTVTPAELAELQIESSKTLDLTQFVDRDEVSPVYIETPYYIYPQNAQAEEAFAVVAQAMRKKKKAAIGRIVLSSREHPVMVEPYDRGLLMSTLRTALEVRQPEFEHLRTDVDAEMVALAETIMAKLARKFEPATFHDRYQDAVRELVEAKIKNRPLPKKERFEGAENVVDLMDALRASLGRDTGAKAPVKSRKKADKRQPAMLLPVKGGKSEKEKEKVRAVAAPQAQEAPKRKRAR